MPRRQDIHSILVIGSGPIVIGQACEFDYSGTQACRVLKDEGFRVILANSNPATIMTDPEFADATYVEPLDVEILTAILQKEKPDAVLPTLGGQTALNLAMELDASGVLNQRDIELIGANAQAIRTAEIRDEFKKAMQEIGLDVPRSGFAYSVQEALEIGDTIGYPIMVRPSFILGGFGTGMAYSREELTEVARLGIEASPRGEILVEQSIAGWKEYELEIMRDCADNCVIICSIENVDPMGVHTGDSITVAPAQTLSDVEYQRMRDAAIACIRRIGVETGGSNVQFALNPTNGDMVIIEMNPRVSRSSALASKATGFPIAKIAARLAVGYRLDEIVNDITDKTPASFEPTIDYVVTKVPRWAFEKFPDSKDTLGSRMQSVGEVMAIGRTFPESLQKALRSLEQGRYGLNCDPAEIALDGVETTELIARAAVATPERIFQLEAALRRGVTVDALHTATTVDPWFLDQLLRISEARAYFATQAPVALEYAQWRELKQLGFSDAQLGYLWNEDPIEIRKLREIAGVFPTYKTVDTCGAEFAADTPYYYSTYEDESEVAEGAKEKVIILGSGPNRIGQGVEFDYCCVHASFALREAGFETVMINCNPETVSTDYDTSDRLYFEPLTYEDVMNVIAAEQQSGNVKGVIVSLGGQTPLKLANSLDNTLVLGTSAASIDEAEDRERWNALCERLHIRQPASGIAVSYAQAHNVTQEIGYPVLIRPSYVLGGRAMRIVYNDDDLASAMKELTAFGSLGREGGLSAERPVLIDRFLEDAVEVDVDAIRDANGDCFIGGIMEHIEEAGVHSGDSSCVLPALTLSADVLQQIENHTRDIAHELDVRGLINVQYAVTNPSDANARVYVIEANPRASRTVPFVAKATGIPLAKIAARIQAGATLQSLRDEGLLRVSAQHAYVKPPHISVKTPVMPFDRFPDADTLLLPEMRSTGEVMGIDLTFGMAFAKSQLAANTRLPRNGTVFFSLADRDKPAGLLAATRFLEMGFDIVATAGTARFLDEQGLQVMGVTAKVADDFAMGGYLPNAAELIADHKIDLVINTPRDGRTPRADGDYIRMAARKHGIACVTTVAAARAVASGIAAWRSRTLQVRSLQELHEKAGNATSWL